MKTRTPCPSRPRFRSLPAAVAVVVASASLFAGAQAASLPLIVPHRNDLPEMDSLRVAIEQSSGRLDGFAVEWLPYTSSSHLVDDLIRRLERTAGPVLVLGPRGSDEAIRLDAQLKGRLDNVLFLSPTITTLRSYSNITLVAACLTDERRIKSLLRLAPSPWHGAKTMFIGMDNAWGRELYRHMTNAPSALGSISPHWIPEPSETVPPQPELLYDQVAQACKAANLPLLFVAVEHAHQLRGLLAALRRQRSSLSPYRPTLCLLADYPFDASGQATDDRRYSIPSELTAEFGITMASEAVLGNETVRVYELLYQDLVTVLQAVRREFSSDTQVLNSLAATFARSSTSQSVLERLNLPIRHSHYFRSLKHEPDYEEPALLKWLPEKRALAGARSWVALQSEQVPWAFWIETARARVPWLASTPLAFVAVGAMILGLMTEVAKRHIFVRRSFASWFARLGVGVGAILLLFSLLVVACWLDWVNPGSFSAVFLLCVMPIALVPTLQDMVLARLPGISQVLGKPSEFLESALDHLANSRCTQATHRNLAVLQEQFDRAVGEADPLEQERWLWGRWLAALRGLDDGTQAGRLADRGWREIRGWDITYDSSHRLRTMMRVVAYTHVVAGSDP